MITKLAFAFAVFWMLMASATLHAQTLSAQDLQNLGYEQKLGVQLPADLSFLNEKGSSTTIQGIANGKPVILVMAYYDCPSLCTVVLNGLLDTVNSLKSEAGRDYQIVVVSIRPNQSIALASAKQRSYAMRYGRPAGMGGWHFLTGDADSIQRLAGSVGFRYAWDPATNQYAHGSGFLVLTPAGTVSQYFLGIEFPPKELAKAIAVANGEKTGSTVTNLLLLCFHYNPVTGKYGQLISAGIKAAAALTLLGLGTYVARLSRKRL